MHDLKIHFYFPSLSQSREITLTQNPSSKTVFHWLKQIRKHLDGLQKYLDGLQKYLDGLQKYLDTFRKYRHTFLFIHIIFPSR